MKSSLSPTALAALPAPDPSARVTSIPPPRGTADHPRVLDFSAVLLGDSSLLRLAIAPAGDRRFALLIAISGEDIVAFDALPSGCGTDTLGFACPHEELHDDTKFWLQTESGLMRLPEPRATAAANQLIAA
jgi:hypothetical protein